MENKKVLINKIKEHDPILYRNLIRFIIEVENDIASHEDISSWLAGMAYVKIALRKNGIENAVMYEIAQKRIEQALFYYIKRHAQKE